MTGTYSPDSRLIFVLWTEPSREFGGNRTVESMIYIMERNSWVGEVIERGAGVC
jgi:hypothetical protein